MWKEKHTQHSGLSSKNRCVPDVVDELTSLKVLKDYCWEISFIETVVCVGTHYLIILALICLQTKSANNLNDKKHLFIEFWLAWFEYIEIHPKIGFIIVIIV